MKFTTVKGSSHLMKEIFESHVSFIKLSINFISRDRE